MIFLLLFLLSSGDLFYAKIVRAMPTLTDKKRALGIALDIERELSRYLGTITLINIGLGLCVGLALWALGVPNPVLWGVLGGAPITLILLLSAGATVLMLVLLPRFKGLTVAYQWANRLNGFNAATP